MTLWPHQEYALAELPRRIVAGERRICLTSPTGGGKSKIICGMIEWAIENGWKSILYTNRRLLIEQLSGVLERHGIRFGVRASGHIDQRERPVQISSLPTENARVIKTDRWQIHGHGEKLLAIIDEAHLNSGGTAQEILARHQESGGVHVGFTATPIDLAHLYDSLVVAGTPSELRRCGALVPAYHYGPDEPDMDRFRANVKTGEYKEADVRKAIMTKCIFGRVLEWYHRLNPEGHPTILFGPGVPESIWFAEQFRAAGIRSAHIDGKGIWIDGEFHTAGQAERDDVLQQCRSGKVKILCNRFVLREGLDLPEVSHLILATVMGSLQTYLQACGRGLRACPGKGRLTIQDHGGMWHRHGSVNLDRSWNLGETAYLLNGLRAERLRAKKEPEPIHCPACGMIRLSGPVCPGCGKEMAKRSRMVMQVNGILREHQGEIYRPRETRCKSDTAAIWERAYFRAKNSKNGMTFNQARGLFFYENHYWPPPTLKWMPRNELDWFRKVADVSIKELNQ